MRRELAGLTNIEILDAVAGLQFATQLAQTSTKVQHKRIKTPQVRLLNFTPLYGSSQSLLGAK
jgi:hypothetical protein